MNFRIGQGFDTHQWVAQRPLILGGITIPHTLGLLGHSDADVLVHAIMDALLGAAGMGDIGLHFPDRDPTFKGADSCQLLSHVVTLLANTGWKIVNVDATVICERPRLAPHVPAMREKLAPLLGITRQEINIKATTTEQLGFTGRNEGAAAMAIALLTDNRPSL
ncbi:MAG: 2-C-methyl-D-erythritol 2,4-cyclodiphosphate synthase [Magnetococcales bacterium]|nr:2-C-methyl-D-erythritol 2,4-cyclodiphosphate synthase [Magnetococcales bacterium]NGZ27639.1 2-C-methyl-D-erythritol 2,4-cyclodiphosphate synthase [Magnetococcales bacterium]